MTIDCDRMAHRSMRTSRWSPSAVSSQAAYSMCSTRRELSDCDFEEARTINGLIAKTPHQNRAKTLSNCDVGVYFEREADSPKLLKILETQSKGRKAWNEGSCLQSRSTVWN